MKISGWAKYPIIDAQIVSPNSIEELIKVLSKKSCIARGNGRSYGDSSISRTNTICMKKFNRIINFDEQTGLITAESGVLLVEIINNYLPKGWFPKVSPGSKFVTIGGMVACDVHGKNHHKDGSFGNYIEWIDLVTSNGEIKRCSKKENTELFNWSIGGMGLTGIIIQVAFYLRPVKTSWIKQKTISAKNIDDTIKIFEKTLDSRYSVAWIDCLSSGKNLGRSIIMLGEHAEISDLKPYMKKNPLVLKNKFKIRIPFNFPSFILNFTTIKIFNLFYYLLGKKNKGYKLVDYDTFFYPLDYLLDWNRIYGKKGFAQFQCVIPLENSLAGIRELLEVISRSKSNSFLTVLKRFGKQDNFLSFPVEGYTLSLDFPLTKNNLEFMKQLDEITIKHRGQFYLAKDSRLDKKNFKRSDTKFENYSKFRGSEIKKTFSSSQSERLGL
jgi:decaprenylphospho-beta-D-ribofuranose 2-oxidase